MTLVERDTPPNTPAPEFNVHPQVDMVASRRTFLKAAGFTFAGFMASDCRPAPQYALPHIRQQPEFTPGRGYSYASTCGACEGACGLLVTTHDGRPTKVEGNPEHPLSGGAVCAVGQASILGLYDNQRLTHPMLNGNTATWAEVDATITERIEQVRQQGGAVRVLTGTLSSPTTTALLDEFIASFQNARHVVYDPISISAIPDAYATTHGIRLLPHYRFDRADVVVGLDADFLGTWISPVEFARSYATKRRVTDNGLSDTFHMQFESRLSLTGSKADQRIRIAPNEIGPIVTHLAARVAARAGTPVSWDLSTPTVSTEVLEELVDRLLAARGRALVVCGSQDVRTQIMCNFLNDLLGSYGTTIDIDQPSYQQQGNDADLDVLRNELAGGDVSLLIVAGVNPIYDLPEASTFAASLRKVSLIVSVADRLDETASVAHVVCPDHHYLESWGDAEPVAGVVSLIQPTIKPLHDTRSLIESLAMWIGRPSTAYDLVREHWQKVMQTRASNKEPFSTFWDRVLERGVTQVATTTRTPSLFSVNAVEPILAQSENTRDLMLVLYPTVGLRDGRHAHNPWLQELPDPITKVTWDNYVSLSPFTAEQFGIKYGDIVRIDTEAGGLELPAFIQPGQHDSIVAIPLGYGRAGTDRFTNIGPQWVLGQTAGGNVGQSAAPLVSFTKGIRFYDGRPVALTNTGRTHDLASTQSHHSLTVPGAVAPIGSEHSAAVQEITASELLHHGDDEHHEEHGELWPQDHSPKGHRWGMAIDLDSCNGCSACVIACQVENNIPVVGHDEVRRHREMHWLRIDRYYSGDDGDIEVEHQPMLCQHCENAPCEVVCPVLATVHSSEGLNEQIYNRCIGTRYCANNCPYKVRRFNWFDYPHDDNLENLVLNPNVTVRTRGVMEKCTFCVQRIEEKKIDAAAKGEPLADGKVQTACQQTCPAQAIVFGDLNDPKSQVSQLSKSARAYGVLEDLNVRPAVRYLKVVRRGDESHE